MKEAKRFIGLLTRFVQKTAKTCTLVVGVLLFLVSCQNEYMRNPFWDGTRAHGYGYYPQRYVPVYQQAPPVQAQRVVKQTSVPMKSSWQSQPPAKSRLPKDQSNRWLPPIPSVGYAARWDKRPLKESPQGGYWVVNPKGQTWYLKPTDFWPFWAREVRAGTVIKIFDPYSSVAAK